MAAAATHRSERVALARACRVMAHRGLVEDVLGHVSQRVGDGELLLRCRGPHERGLRFTEPADIRLVDLDGRLLENEGGYEPPTEAPIHLATMRRRPAVGAVVHAHPPAVVVASLAGVQLLPVFGSYDIPAARLAAAGIPTYPRSVLIRRADLAAEMLDTMGDAPVCVLAGHGLVSVGRDHVEATLRALAVDRLARITLDLHRIGGAPTAIPERDLAELPDLGVAFNQGVLWRHHLAALAADGRDIDDADLGEGHP